MMNRNRKECLCSKQIDEESEYNKQEMLQNEKEKKEQLS